MVSDNVTKAKAAIKKADADIKMLEGRVTNWSLQPFAGPVTLDLGSLIATTWRLAQGMALKTVDDVG